VSETENIKGTQPPSGSAALADMAGRLQQVFDATDRAVAEIQAEAEAEAARYLEQRKAEANRMAEARLREAERVIQERLRKLADAVAELVRQAERVKIDIEEMDPQLAPGPSIASTGAGEARPESSDESGASNVTSIAPPSSPGGHGEPAALEEAMLRATQMAVAGSTREEIEVVLRDEYRVLVPAPIVDEILGPKAS
jgi:hypothetical protein